MFMYHICQLLVWAAVSRSLLLLLIVKGLILKLGGLHCLTDEFGETVDFVL